MAYRCSKYNKILVGPKKSCENCEEGGLESKCEHRVWQEGILKVGGQRTRGKWRQIWPKGIDGPCLPYILKEDGKYHYEGKIPENLEILILESLTPEEMEFVKANRRNYFELLKH